MLDVGWTELLVIGALALIVVGPRDLPQLLHQVGRWVGQIKRMAGEFQRSIEDAARDTDLNSMKELRDLRKDLGGLDFRQQAAKAQSYLKQSVKVEPTAGAKPGAAHRHAGARAGGSGARRLGRIGARGSGRTGCRACRVPGPRRELVHGRQGRGCRQGRGGQRLRHQGLWRQGFRRQGLRRMNEKHIEDSSAPLIEHLIELRRRLIWSIVALGLTTALCFIFRFEMWDLLSQPLLRADPLATVQSLSPQETFLTVMNLSVWGGFFLSFPIIAVQLWLFVAPGLYKNEQAAFLPFLIATPFLFILGAALAYFLVIPLALNFLIEFAENTSLGGGVLIENENRFSEYVGFIKVMLLAFGASFELPVLLTLLGRVGIVSADGLARARKYAIVGIAAGAAVITPPDVMSQFLLGIPVYMLYEISIWLVRAFERRRAAEEAELEAELASWKEPEQAEGRR